MDSHFEELTEGIKLKTAVHVGCNTASGSASTFRRGGRRKQDMKTRSRKEDGAADEKFGDVSPVEVGDDPISRTRFGGDALAGQGANASNSFLSVKRHANTRRWLTARWRCPFNTGHHQ